MDSGQDSVNQGCDVFEEFVEAASPESQKFEKKIKEDHEYSGGRINLRSHTESKSVKPNNNQMISS